MRGKIDFSEALNSPKYVETMAVTAKKEWIDVRMTWGDLILVCKIIDQFNKNGDN